MSDLQIPHFESPYALPPVKYNSTWHLVFEEVGQRDPNKPAFVDGASGKGLTWAELRKISRRLASSLVDQLGLRPGQVVMLFAASTPYYPAAVYGTQAAKIICTFANHLYTLPEVAHVLQDSNVDLLITDAVRLPLALQAAKKAGLPANRIFLLDIEDSGSQKSIWSTLTSRELEPSHLTEAQARSTTAYRCYSSGTTGLPKGVEGTHANMCAVVNQLKATAPGESLQPRGGSMWAETCRKKEVYHSDHRFICFVPFFHISGLTTFLFNGPFLGVTVYLLPAFDFNVYLDMIKKYKITMSHVVVCAI